jgi:hypothetical protein
MAPPLAPSSGRSSPSQSPQSTAVSSPYPDLALSSDLSHASPASLFNLASLNFLTRHFPEACRAVKLLLNSPEPFVKKKAWGIYLVILDNALHSSEEDGIRQWGRHAWLEETRKVRGEGLWNELLQSMEGLKAEIDAEVMLAMYRTRVHR